MTETGQSQEFRKSLSREISVRWAHSPIYSFSPFFCLLMLTSLTLVLNTVLHRWTSPLTLHCAVPQLQSPFTLLSTLVAPLYRTQWLTVARLLLSCCLLALYAAYSTSWTCSSQSLIYPSRILYLFLVRERYGLICCLFHILNLFQSVLDIRISNLISLSYTGTVWHTGRLDFRGFADCYTRHCCPLLHYNNNNINRIIITTIVGL